MDNQTEFLTDLSIVNNEIQIINHNLTCDADNKINISEHYLYLILNLLITVAFSLPTNKIYLIYLHSLLTIAFLLQCFWSWEMICGSNLFTWSIAFFILNSFNTIKILIQKKEVTFSVSLLNDAYSIIFEPMAISRNQIKKLFSPELAKIICLEQGDRYAVENSTKTDKLSLLLSGRMMVTCGENFLHFIGPMQFLDSPEFQSSKTVDEKFRVTILAETNCKVLCWQKSTLQYFLGKESFLSNIFSIVLSNDIANKLFRMNQKVQIEKGNYPDIRKTLFLPSLSKNIGKFLYEKSDDESDLSFQQTDKLINDKSVF